MLEARLPPFCLVRLLPVSHYLRERASSVPDAGTWMVPHSLCTVDVLTTVRSDFVPPQANRDIIQQNLWDAVASGKRLMVRRAVEDDGADVLKCNPNDGGMTAVHYAAAVRVRRRSAAPPLPPPRTHAAETAPRPAPGTCVFTAQC